MKVVSNVRFVIPIDDIENVDIVKLTVGNILMIRNTTTIPPILEEVMNELCD